MFKLNFLTYIFFNCLFTHILTELSGHEREIKLAVNIFLLSVFTEVSVELTPTHCKSLMNTNDKCTKMLCL